MNYQVNTVPSSLASFFAVIIYACAVSATPLPSSIDSGRVDTRAVRKPAIDSIQMPPRIEDVVHQGMNAPKGSKTIRFTLRDLHLKGSTVFTDEQIQDVISPHIGKTITLDTLWLIAGQLTERYQSQGYFLSRVYVPAQEIDGNKVTLQASEGYVSSIVYDDSSADHAVVQEILDHIKNQRPITSRVLESDLLRLNDLSGISVRAVLALPKDKNAPEGATELHLLPTSEPSEAGRVFIDNNGSNYMGPYEMGAVYSREILPLQRTSANIFVSLPWDELNYGTLRHELPLFMGATIEAYGSYTKARPGDSLAVQEIQSESLFGGIGFNYQWLRQRDENFSSKVALEARDTKSTILGDPLSQDAVRAIRLAANYDRIDSWQGFSQMGATFSQGINAFGASESGGTNLSREGAATDFRKLELNLSRYQALGHGVTFLAAVSGQIASDPLFSSEEFGYGGQAFGRAYDASEITGDDGIAASLELRYNQVNALMGVTPTPYVFYDIGEVWNQGSSQMKKASGSSAGIGLRTMTDIGLATNLAIALPLTREAENPLLGHNGNNPRLIFEVAYGF
jgi:hemolysin activation/secretion protein